MTAEEIVRAKYPNADLQYNKPVSGGSAMIVMVIGSSICFLS